MSTSRQYLACKFRPEDARIYTYHNDGEPVAAGDVLEVEGRSGQGTRRVHCISVTDHVPAFATKPILGKCEPEAATNADLLTFTEN